MELHRILQSVLEEEEVFEVDNRMGIDVFNEMERQKTDLRNKDLAQNQGQRHNFRSRTGFNAPWQSKWEKKFKRKPTRNQKQRTKQQSSILTALSQGFETEATEVMQQEDNDDQLRKTLLNGLNLARFLTEAGWHLTATRVYQTCSALLDHRKHEQEGNLLLRLDLLTHLLDSAISSSQVKSAYDLAEDLQKYLDYNHTQLLAHNSQSLASPYRVLSNFFQQRSKFDQSHDWACKALNALSSKSPTKVTPIFFLTPCVKEQGTVERK